MTVRVDRLDRLRTANRTRNRPLTSQTDRLARSQSGQGQVELLRFAGCMTLRRLRFTSIVVEENADVSRILKLHGRDAATAA
jgi:hypothetical protein